MPPPPIKKSGDPAQASKGSRNQEKKGLCSPKTPSSSGTGNPSNMAPLQGRKWADLSDSDKETEIRPLDLESRDPRPESTIMAGWGQGFTVPTASTAEGERQRSSRIVPLTLEERVTVEGKKVDSTLPFISGVHQAPEFNTPRESLPAWRDHDEFIQNLDGSRLLIVKAPTDSGKTTIFPALVAHALPKRFGRICCARVRRATAQGVCTGTRRMWSIKETNKIVGSSVVWRSPLNGTQAKLGFVSHGRNYHATSYENS